MGTKSNKQEDTLDLSIRLEMVLASIRGKVVMSSSGILRSVGQFYCDGEKGNSIFFAAVDQSIISHQRPQLRE